MTRFQSLPAAFVTVSVLNTCWGHRWAALCPKDQRKTSALGNVSNTSFLAILT